MSPAPSNLKLLGTLPLQHRSFARRRPEQRSLLTFVTRVTLMDALAQDVEIMLELDHVKNDVIDGLRPC